MPFNAKNDLAYEAYVKNVLWLRDHEENIHREHPGMCVLIEGEKVKIVAPNMDALAAEARRIGADPIASALHDPNRGVLRGKVAGPNATEESTG